MANYEDTAARFVQVCRGDSERFLTAYSGKMFGQWDNDGPTLYSYGRHFPLAVYLAAGEHGRRRPLYLLNGDRYSVTTTRHQNETRAAVHRDEWRADVIVLPFTALDAAGIIRRTIRPLDVRADRWEETERATTRADDAPKDVRDAGPDADGVYRWEERRHFLGDSLFTAAVAETRAVSRSLSVSDVAATVRAHVYRPLHELRRALESLPPTIRENRPVNVRRKFLSSFDHNEPAALYFLAELPRTPAATVAAAYDSLAPRAVHAALARGRDVQRQGDIFAIATDLTAADVYALARRRSRLSVFRGNGKPRAGEVGFVPADRRRRAIAAEYRRNRASGWAASGRAAKTAERVMAPRPPTARMIETAAAETLAAERAAIETRRANRAANRPRGPRPASAVLRSARVVHGEWVNDDTAHGYRTTPAALDVFRRDRGDGWASPAGADVRTKPRRPRPDSYSSRAALASWPARELARVQDTHRRNRVLARGNVGPARAADAYWRARAAVDSIERQPIARALSIHGTAHSATEVAIGPRGVTYARGRLYHEPALESAANGRGFTRERDHVTRPLGDGSTWYVMLRNTVPRARAGLAERGT